MNCTHLAVYRENNAKLLTSLRTEFITEYLQHNNDLGLLHEIYLQDNKVSGY